MITQPLIRNANFIPPPPPPAATPRGRALQALGLSKDAARADRCGWQRWIGTSQDSCKFKEQFSCRSNFCPHCSKGNADMATKRFMGKYPQGEKFFVLEIHGPVVGRGPKASLEAFGTHVLDTLRGVCSGAHYRIVIRNGRWVAKVICWGPVAPPDSISVSYGSDHLALAVRRVLDPECPDTPKLQAAYELAFHGTRAIRTFGKPLTQHNFHGESDRYLLIQSSEVNTDGEISPDHRHHRCCSHGFECDRATRYTNDSLDEPFEEDWYLRWSPIGGNNGLTVGVIQ